MEPVEILKARGASKARGRPGAFIRQGVFTREGPFIRSFITVPQIARRFKILYCIECCIDLVSIKFHLNFICFGVKISCFWNVSTRET